MIIEAQVRPLNHDILLCKIKKAYFESVLIWTFIKT